MFHMPTTTSADPSSSPYPPALRRISPVPAATAAMESTRTSQRLMPP